MTDAQTDTTTGAQVGYYMAPAVSRSVVTDAPVIAAIDAPLPTSTQAPRLYLVAVIALAVGVILAILLAGALAFTGRVVPDVIGNLGTICAVALAAMLGYKQGQGT